MLPSSLDVLQARPHNGEMLALFSVWIALGALITSLALVFLRASGKETVATLLPYTVAFSATLAAAVLWGLRKDRSKDSAIAGQRLQSVVSLALNSVTFAVMLVWLHGWIDASLGLAVEFGFLAFVYWLYTRILVRE